MTHIICTQADIELIKQSNRKERTVNNKLRDPLPEELNTPKFKAVWNCIKNWDIATGLDKDDFGNDLYSCATGNHVVAILESLHEGK